MNMTIDMDTGIVFYYYFYYTFYYKEDSKAEFVTK